MRGFYEATLLLVDVVPIFLVLIYQSRCNPEMMRVSAQGKAFTEQEREKDLQEDVRVLQTTYLADGSLRAEVLPPRNQAAYKLLATAIVIAISVVAVNQFFVARQMALLPSSPRIAFYRFIQIMVSLASAYIVAKVLTGREVLTMSRRELRVQHVLLGITGSVRNFETRNLTDLRFAQWQVASSNGLKNRSGLSFQVGSTAETFGTALTKTQVDDLISKMRAVSQL